MLLTRLAQVIVGMVFLFSGLAKGLDPMGTGLKITEYIGLVGLSIDLSTATILAVVLNVTEALIGISLLLGIWRGGVPIAALVLIVPFTLLTLYLWIANPIADCGCFGDALKLSNAATFWKNVLLLALLLLLLRQRQSMYGIPKGKTEVLTALVAVVVLLSFNLYPLLYLPAIDFRPYKVGTPLSRFVAPEGDDGLRYIYSRDGEERAFTAEELSQVDSTWTYLRYEEIPVEQGTAPAADFILLDEAGNEVGHRLAAPDGRALLFLTYDLETMTEEELQLGLDLQRLTKYPVTLVIPNPLDEVDEHPLAELIRQYREVRFMDLKMIQTIIRSNPGLVVIDRGVLVNKLSYTSLRYQVRDAHFRKYIFSQSK